ncbi:MAG: methyltransferase domain-containing protein [Alphaproteobacteria bacterium]
MTSDEFFQAQHLHRDGDFAAAASLLKDILDNEPKHVAAWRLYAGALRELGRAVDADAADRTGNAIEADHTADIGASLLFHGDVKRGRVMFERALALDANCLTAHWLLGDIEGREGSNDRALAHYRRCLEIEPTRNGPAYMIAALGAGTAPVQAPSDYVTDFFDWYAEEFDQHLTENLKYNGPQQVAGALRVMRPGGVGPTIDLGCGTGLAGLAVQGLVGPLIGVDLSSEMLRKAEVRGVYEKLIEDELLPALQSRPDASADAILAADVFVYVGELAPLFRECFRVLVPGGIFIATFEDARGATESWKLEHSGRYAHALGYLESIADDAGFSNVVSGPIVLREEYGAPVRSLLVSFERVP